MYLKNKISFIVCIVCFLTQACKKEARLNAYAYKDTFEDYLSEKDMIQAYPDQNKLWSFTQITYEGNFVNIDTSLAYTGKKCVKFYGLPSQGSKVSKASITKQGLNFVEGQTIRISLSYFLVDTNKLNWVFLMSLYEKIPIGAGPGMRLACFDNKVLVEYKMNDKDDKRNIYQNTSTEINVPKQKWFRLSWEIKLSSKNKGHIKVWQDTRLIIERNNVVTLPKDQLYYQQGTQGRYTNIGIGLVDNANDIARTLYCDDFDLQIVSP